MTDLGLDVEELVHEECVGVVTNNDVEHVKDIFSKMSPSLSIINARLYRDNCK